MLDLSRDTVPVIKIKIKSFVKKVDINLIYFVLSCLQEKIFSLIFGIFLIAWLPKISYRTSFSSNFCNFAFKL